MSAHRLVLIDDELHIIRVLSYKLKQAGYEVATAHDGDEGYRAIHDHKPDLIVTDYQMPSLDGYELSVRLKAEALTASIPVIMLTARGHRLKPSELMKTNIQCLLAKPFSANQLLDQIAELLGADAHEPENTVT